MRRAPPLLPLAHALWAISGRHAESAARRSTRDGGERARRLVGVPRSTPRLPSRAGRGGEVGDRRPLRRALRAPLGRRRRSRCFRAPGHAEPLAARSTRWGRSAASCGASSFPPCQAPSDPRGSLRRQRTRSHRGRGRARSGEPSCGAPQLWSMTRDTGRLPAEYRTFPCGEARRRRLRDPLFAGNGPKGAASIEGRASDALLSDVPFTFALTARSRPGVQAGETLGGVWPVAGVTSEGGPPQGLPPGWAGSTTPRKERGR